MKLRDCPYCDNHLCIFEHYSTDETGLVMAYVECSICHASSIPIPIGIFAPDETRLIPVDDEPPTLTGGSPK